MRQDEQASDKAVSTGESSPPKKNKIALPNDLDLLVEEFDKRGIKTDA